MFNDKEVAEHCQVYFAKRLKGRRKLRILGKYRLAIYLGYDIFLKII